MDPQIFVEQLKRTEEFFNRATACLQEEHSSFCPTPDMLSTAGQVAHVASTIDWFMEGAFRPEGFDLDFEKLAEKTLAITSLADARAWVERSFHQAREIAASRTAEEWMQPLPAGMVMGGAPRCAVMGGIDDHTAHHRGSLAVYSRLLKLVPPMPYM